MNGGATDPPAPIDVAIVGAGIIGANHAAAVDRHPRLRVAALVDPDEAASGELARRIAERTGTGPPGRYPNLADALADRPIGLVAICTPSGLHAPIAEQAVAAGAHVVIEKPLDVTLRRARRLADAATDARSRGLVVSVVSQHRFDPASVAVADAVAAGQLGPITSAVASVPWWRDQGYYDSADWRGTWAYDGGGALMNQGVHTVDLLLWLLGRPVEVSAQTARLAHHGIEVEDVAVATVRFASGALAVLHATTAAYPGLGMRLQVHGTRGSAVIHDDQLEYFHVAGDTDDRPPRRPPNQAAERVPVGDLRGAPKSEDGFVLGHLRQYQDVVDAIDQRRPPGVTVEDGLLSLAVVEAVYRSAALARPVAVADVLAGAFDDLPYVTGGTVPVPAGEAGPR
ncbi:Gfo/Idh/MocA family protein [Micromonospora sp. NBC_01796]|uniref:Gfo/Idh/MocA family protein n=1 Tax=Micromonospora sp. NBC_01796 TaxID=2975987 RepID=UPI002DD7E588|nr:Gfo/Idh/MocA family oxidoreductase [Micromonospora sp. NBC_01796]WSA84491.1 Gfo/Idh/MocA family oxidoreductase [Micromonospora sp. NBC_01796]